MQCTIFIIFLQVENEIADMCTNFIVFRQVENKMVDVY